MATSDDFTQLVEDDQLDRDLQPHLGSLKVRGTAVDASYDNEALDESHNVAESHAYNSHHPQNDTFESRLNQNGTNSNQLDRNNAEKDSELRNGRTVSEGSVTVDLTQNGVVSPPVFYSNRSGEATVVNEPVIVRRADGTSEIQTQQCCALAPHRHVAEKPLRLRQIKLLKGFSIMAIVLFFPLGIPAMYYAFKTEKAFHEGIMQGSIDKARKLAKRTERLIIFSVMAALLVAVAVFAVVERHLMADDEEYWKSKSNGAIMPTG